MQAHSEHDMRYYRQEKNQGKGAAIRKGFELATGDFIVIQDADLEYDPEEYNLLLAPILKGVADVVYGSRFMGTRCRSNSTSARALSSVSASPIGPEMPSGSSNPGSVRKYSSNLSVACAPAVKNCKRHNTRVNDRNDWSPKTNFLRSPCFQLPAYHSRVQSLKREAFFGQVCRIVGGSRTNGITRYNEAYRSLPDGCIVAEMLTWIF